MTTKTLKIADIAIDLGTQARAEIDQDTVDDYALAILRGDIFPVVTVFEDGIKLILADGFHRFHGHRKAGKETIDADVRTGTLHEAKAHAYQMPRHGKRWTSADKRKVIGLMLDTAEWGERSDRAIADHIGVDHTTVGTVRRSLVDSTSKNVVGGPQGDKVVRSSGGKRTVRTKHGTVTQVDTKKINAGRKKTDKHTSGAKGDDATKPAAIPPSSDDDLKIPVEPAAPKTAENHAPPKEEPAAPNGSMTAEERRDAIDDLERASFELRRVQSERDDYRRAMEAQDGTKALATAVQRMHHAERRTEELMAEASSARKRAAFYEKQLARVGKAIGQPDLDKIAPAAEAMMRKFSAAEKLKAA